MQHSVCSSTQPAAFSMKYAAFTSMQHAVWSTMVCPTHRQTSLTHHKVFFGLVAMATIVPVGGGADHGSFIGSSQPPVQQ